MVGFLQKRGWDGGEEKWGQEEGSGSLKRARFGIRRTPRQSGWQRHSVEREERMNVSSDKAELEAYCKESYKEFGPHL